MKLLDEKGIGTVWSICKEKFALVGHTHNYAGSGSPGGSANSAIGVVDYGEPDEIIQIGYHGRGITGNQIKYIAGYTTSGNSEDTVKIKNVSKDALKAWLGLGSLAYSSSSIPTKLSQLTNDKGFVTGSVSGNTVTINGASTTWTNTWRGIQDNLTSTSTSESLSANQGRILKSLVDGKANSSDLSSYAHKSDAVKDISFSLDVNNYTQTLDTIKADRTVAHIEIPRSSESNDGFMSAGDKIKLNGIAAGANNYTLPTASDTALGGIKVSANANGSSWPICVDDNGLAQTKIAGLVKNNNMLSAVILSDESSSANYGLHGVFVEDRASKNSANISFPLKSGSFALTSDIPTKTSQLTNDSTFLTSADKYTLPIASMGTLGGIRASSTYSKNDELWPIVVDGSAAAHTHIAGLYKNNNGSIANITIKSNNGSIVYGPTTIQTYDTKNNLNGVLNVPKKFGTLALTDDIPDVSNLCKLNFVNSISDCVNGRINFLFKNSNDYVDLSFLHNLEEGTISLIYSPFVEFSITDKGSVWYYNGRSVASEDTAYISKAKLVLAFFKDIYVYVCTFSYN